MSKLLGWLVRVLVLVLVQARYPAAVQTEAKPLPMERDPSYAIYQRYRYAYDRYGYLFLSEETGGTDVQGGTLPGDAGAQGTFGTQGIAGGGDPGAAIIPGAAGTQSAAKIPGAMGTQSAAGLQEKAAITMAQIQDYDFLMKHFYSVHTSTTAGRDLMKAETLLGEDMKLQKDSQVPQILIYHTHSQERYADYSTENPGAGIVEVGSYLAELLRAKGWNVIHDTATYDIQGGELDRNRAYTYALEGITGILQANPTIQVILDVHRDGVREDLKLVSEVGGKPTANIMFFQGMSRTPQGPIEYLPNPYLQGNLAFSFQMQLAAEGRYPGLTRKIYLKGLRYNMHLRPRSALIEVGAQTNTVAEARNAMEPLAELLDMVLQGD